MKLRKTKFYVQLRELDGFDACGIAQYKYVIDEVDGHILKTQQHLFGIYKTDKPKDRRLKSEYVCVDLRSGFEIVRKPRRINIIEEIEQNAIWVMNYEKLQQSEWYHRIIKSFEREKSKLGCF